jgi:hypothetical protein
MNVEEAVVRKRRALTRTQVAEHNTKTDCWIIVHGKVCDVSSFIHEHPGGARPLTKRAGDDATKAFDRIGHSPHASDLLAQLCIGELASEAGDLEAGVAPPAAEIQVNTPDVHRHRPGAAASSEPISNGPERGPPAPPEMSIPSMSNKIAEKRLVKSAVEERVPVVPSKGTQNKRKSKNAAAQLFSTAAMIRYFLLVVVLLVVLYRAVGLGA